MDGCSAGDAADLRKRGTAAEYGGTPYLDDIPRRIDDHQRFLGRSEVDINASKDNVIKRLENCIKHLEKCLQDLESDYKAKAKSYYLEKMRADEFEKDNRTCQERSLQDLSLEKLHNKKFEKENREYQEKLRGLYSQKARADNHEKENREYEEKLRGLYPQKARADNLEKENREYHEKLRGLYSQKAQADNLEKENREYQVKLRGLNSQKARVDALEQEIREYEEEFRGLYSQKARTDNLEKENRDYQEKLQMKERKVGELLLKLQASGAATAALEVKDAELKILQSAYQNIRRENQELKSWRIEHKKKLQNDMSTTGDDLLKHRTCGAPTGVLRDASNNYRNIRLENQELKSWRIIENETKLQNGVSTTEELNTKGSDLTTANDQSKKQRTADNSGPGPGKARIKTTILSSRSENESLRLSRRAFKCACARSGTNRQNQATYCSRRTFKRNLGCIRIGWYVEQIWW